MRDRNEWVQFANCATTDPNLFFPEWGGTAVPAKRICAACTVRAECAQESLENDEEHGIWGQLSRTEREQLRRNGTAA